MAASLETRAPFLDHELVELAWRMPVSVEYRAGRSKWIVRRLLERQLPSGLIDRPKHAFILPMHERLRGPLRDWAEDLLDGLLLAADGLLDVERMRTCCQQHLSGRCDWRDPLWNLLSFLAWRRAYRAHSGRAQPCA
jgi:asparagine synthase (glutamine-hydrolysing)